MRVIVKGFMREHVVASYVTFKNGWMFNVIKGKKRLNRVIKNLVCLCAPAGMLHCVGSVFQTRDGRLNINKPHLFLVK